ncbi:MAG TPA: fimbria/pilus outer membrane usher protein [Candidatus Baltobacteraceae bacterium]|nr:fimbria/pilus outer membrane usher protein [Candidatus Baltobacteraceae bacterium]
MRAVAALFALVVLIARPVLAAEETTDAFDPAYTLERYRVSIDGVEVDPSAAVYMSTDESETVYVSSKELDAWNLKRPREPAFERSGQQYFGLQTDLKLATSYDRTTHELEIVAPRTAFRGQPRPGKPPVTPGSGAFLNYDLRQDNQSYDFFAVNGAGVFQMKYISSTGADGLQFVRSVTRWYRLYPASHSLVTFGDNTNVPGWLGTGASFGGLHYATDYTSDPEYSASGPPMVSGFAASPSLLEVYVDNILELTRDVPQGPFTVNGLPASAANSQIVMVLTDRNGNKTVQVASPQYTSSPLPRGTSNFQFDSGVAHENVNQRGQYYRGLVADGTYRYGITNTIAGELYGESIKGEDFADGGADFSLGTSTTFGFRAGGGDLRHSSEYRFQTSIGGNVTFSDTYRFNSSTPLALGDDFDNAQSLISENSSLNVTLSQQWGLGFQFQRSRDNIGGSNQSSLSTDISYTQGILSLTISPYYDFITRQASANANVRLRLDANHRLTLTPSVTASGETGAGVEWSQDPTDDNPISMKLKLSANASQDRRFEIGDSLPWAVANFNWQQQKGVDGSSNSINEEELQGAIATVGGGIFAIPTVNNDESFGVLQIPGAQNVRVQVNGSPVGRTNTRGNLLLRNLSPYKLNEVIVDTADVPIWYNLADPIGVTPSKAAPVRLRARILSKGGATFTAVDARGIPLAAASDLVLGTERYPVGYGGSVYVPGIAPGRTNFTGVADGHPCTIDLVIPGNVNDIPNLGTVRCI